MPSTFTDNTGIEKIADGEQSGLWGQTTNTNFDIVDRALNGSVEIPLSGTTHTLTTSSGLLSDGQFAVLVFTGSLSGANTVTVSPNTAQKLYWVSNTTSQNVILSQGSGANVTVPSGATKAVFTNGAGAGATVFDITNTLAGNLTGNVAGNASTATALENARNLTIGNTTRTFDGTANVSWSLADIGVNNATLTLATSGIASGSQTFTANQGANATFTVNVPGTNLGSSGTGETRTITSSTGSSTSITYTAADLSAVPTSRNIGTSGIATGGGDLTQDRTINVPGTNLGSSGTGGTRTITSSTGSNTSISYTAADLGAAPTSRTLTAGTGLTGGGNLTANRTFNIDEATVAEATAGTASNKVITPRRVTLAAWPVGSTFIQFPGRTAPNSLFGGSWSAIFDNEGIFFRTPGSGASSFGGGIQSDQMQRITGSFESRGLGSDNVTQFINRSGMVGLNARSGSSVTTVYQPASAGISEYNRDVYTFDSASSPSSRTSSSTSGETRPRNRTVRVWRRTS